MVSSDCRHGPKEILTGEFSRYLVPRREPAALAKAMDAALNDYPDCATAEILQQVGAKRVAEQYLALLNGPDSE